MPDDRDFAAEYRALLASPSQPIIPAAVGRLVGDLLDEVGRLRARVAGGGGGGGRRGRSCGISPPCLTL